MEITLKPLTKETCMLKSRPYDKTKATVEVVDNKLVLSKDAVEALDVLPNDRIAIAYWNVDNQTTFPLIGNAKLFDNQDGNRLTKSLTVSYRGMQKDVLLRYGSRFLLEPFNKYFKLVKNEIIENDTLQEEERCLEELNN